MEEFIPRLYESHLKFDIKIKCEVGLFTSIVVNFHLKGTYERRFHTSHPSIDQNPSTFSLFKSIFGTTKQ